MDGIEQNIPKRIRLISPNWIGKIGGQYEPRIEISNEQHWCNNSFVVVNISKTPEVVSGVCKLNNNDLQDVFEWIMLNYDILLKIYYNSIVEFEMY